MNPLMKVKLIHELNAREAELGVREVVYKAKYKDSAWIFVGGLHYELTEGDVICVFSQYGEVVNINLVRDKRTGKSKGFCFLCYEDERSAILAVDNLNGFKIKGWTIRVDHVANYRPPRESEDWDEVTRALHAKGCGVKTPPHTSSDSLSEDEDVAMKMKKGKWWSRAEWSKSSPQAGKQVSTEEPHPRIKMEKEDPGYERYAGGTSDRTLADFGSWERHTKGIGQKLLQKMGYVPGRGLGKNAQGIINPIEVKQRKGRGAVGAYGSERTLQSLQDFSVVDSEKKTEEEFQMELSQWQKGPNGSKKQPKYSYKTVEELKAQGRISKQLAVPQKELSQVKVIDMTSREPKVYYSYSQISRKHNIPDDSPQHPLGRDSKPQGFALPELEYNLQLLIDITEQEIIQSDRQLQYERDMVVNLSHEIQKMTEVLSHEEKAISNLSKVLDMVDECERQMQPGCENPLTLDECAKIFQTLQDKYYEEYRMSDRVDLAVAIVFPLMKEYFKNWDPLKDCTYGTEIIGKWKILLENGQLLSHSGQDLSTNAFHRLMWEIWMPYVRNIVARWQPRNCGCMVDFLDSWVNVVPLWILDNILDQLIFPKLQQEVESWNPLTDTVPIHSWIHPWLPLMQARLEPLYSPIRNKLANALQKWHPSDSSAKFVLQPWKDVFTPSSWEAFMVKNIVPKLGMCLNELIINPHEQHMDVFYWVIDWEGMISVSSLTGLLEKHFFPKWLLVLCFWLSNSPNYDEIIKWYLGWKSMFSDQVLAHPSIKDKFNEALDIMNRAVSSSVGGYTQPGARENIAYLMHTERRKDFPSGARHEQREAENMVQHGIRTATRSVPMNFKDLIQTKAEEHNIVFMPVIGKQHKGKQLYTFGRIVIYIDRAVVFVQGEKTWVPTSLQSLIDMAK